MSPDDHTLDEMFRASAARFPDRNFLHFYDGERDEKTTYGEALVHVAHAVERLQAAGLRPGDRVVAYGDQTVPSVYWCLAAANAEVIPAPIGPSFSIDVVRNTAERIGAKMILCTPDKYEVMRAAGVPFLCFSPTGADSDTVVSLAGGSRSVAEALAFLEHAGRGHGPDDLYVLQPTSGTIGRPKLVMRPHRVFARAARLETEVEMGRGLKAEHEPPQRYLLVAALTHGMGQYLLASAAHVGATLVMPSRIGMASKLADVRHLDPTLIGIPPRLLRLFLEQYWALPEGERGARVFGPSAQVVSLGGAPADIQHLETVHSQGVDVSDSWGASECSLVSLSPRGEFRPGFAGKLLPDVEIRISDAGELQVKRTPWMMKGYWGDEELTREAFTDDGYYRTGDNVEVIDGWVRVRGRIRDVFNTFMGTNIFPVLVEEQIESIPWAKQAILVGDCRPFLAALVVVSGPPAPGDGYLEPARHAELYAHAFAALDELNRGLEPDHQVLSMALFSKPFPAGCYTYVGHAKAKRHREAVETEYAELIRSLYSQPPQLKRRPR